MSYDPFQEKSIKAKANQREKSMARKRGCHLHPNSGALDLAHGDFSDDQYLFDSKDNSVGNLKSTLAKITREASSQRKVPVILFSMSPCPLGVDETWVIMPEDEFNRLRGK